MMYMSNEPPVYVDRFWEVIQLIDDWNANMAHNGSPSWINAIDESMSKWVSEYTYPGFMYVPHKPWQFGNEYHDAGCADRDIIWQVNLREGTDRPTDLGRKDCEEKGETCGTLLWLTQPVHGFCVLQAIVELKKHVFFAHALINKRRYWPKHVPGEQILQHFADKAIRSADAIKGEFRWGPFLHLQYAGTRLHNDADVSIQHTTDHGFPKNHHYMEGGVKKSTTFVYPEVVHNHDANRDVIDNHNAMRMHPISMEETWMTSRWPNRVLLVFVGSNNGEHTEFWMLLCKATLDRCNPCS